jgi:proteasome lid subunit RPN8/RPN11
MSAEVDAPRHLAARLAQSDVLAEAFRSVEPAYPHEGCGFIFEQDGTLELVPTRNLASELHAKNPEAHPRDGADWFEPDMKPWLRAVRRGAEPRVVLHSHPDVGAYFSVSDRRSAVYVDDDGLSQERNPGVVHLVISVRGGAADGAKLFSFSTALRDFVEVAEFDAAGGLVSG